MLCCEPRCRVKTEPIPFASVLLSTVSAHLLVDVSQSKGFGTPHCALVGSGIPQRRVRPKFAPRTKTTLERLKEEQLQSQAAATACTHSRADRTHCVRSTLSMPVANSSAVVAAERIGSAEQIG